MLNVIDREVAFVTWLRYTAWIPLYPTGFVLEGTYALFNKWLKNFDERPQNTAHIAIL